MVERHRDPISPDTGSHPSIRFEPLPVVRGKIFDLETERAVLLSQVLDRTRGHFPKESIESLLTEALFAERVRLKKVKRLSPGYLFLRKRDVSDRKLWKAVQKGLLKGHTERDIDGLFTQTIVHYSNEICGHFDQRVYRFATSAVPYFFNWLLNAASLKKVLPWGMQNSLSESIRIVGQIPELQKLSQNGTILLVPTHQSNIDSVLLGYIIYMMSLPPFAYGAGLNLFTNPALSFFMSSLGAYTVDRQKNNEIYKAVLKNYSTSLLKDGVHSIFFPGGGRARSGAIESRLKLGLIGTGLQAQLERMKAGHPKPNVYIVPMVMSYHFVLEAASLIEDYLVEIGKHRFMRSDTDESFQAIAIMKFFWKFFAKKTDITVRIGQAMDVFGNDVDENGRSLGPNGTTIDPARWLSTRGELQAEPQRDHEYTRQVGHRISELYYQHNTVLTSHAVAFAYFRLLQRKYPHLDLFRFLRLSRAQRTLPVQQFFKECDQLFSELSQRQDQGGLFLSRDFLHRSTEDWAREGVLKLGLYHDLKVIELDESAVSTDDLSLVYYYRNRLSGYGLSLPSSDGRPAIGRGGRDEKGFLA